MEKTAVRNVEVPSLGYGTWQLEGEDCERGVQHALEVGYRHVDTAQMYGNEDLVGKAIEASAVDRDDIWLTTKVGNDSNQPGEVRPSLEESLRKLRTDYVDLLLIHWPNPDTDQEEVLRNMVALVEEGKVRHIGVSNFPPSWLERAQKVGEIFCNQVEYHPYLSQKELHRRAVEQDFLLTAYSPLARGQALDDDTLTEIGEERGASAGQVALRWLIQQDHVVTIPKATSPAHIEMNFRAQDLTLSDEEMERIGALDRGERLVDPPFSVDWER